MGEFETAPALSTTAGSTTPTLLANIHAAAAEALGLTLDSAFTGVQLGLVCHATRITTAVAIGTSVIVDLNAEDIDVAAFHNPSSNPSRLTVPAGMGGTYLVVGSASIGKVGGGTCPNETARMLIRKTSGATVTYPGSGIAVLSGLNSGVPVVHALAVVALAAGDYVEMYLDSATSCEVEPNDATYQFTFLSLFKVKP